MKKLCKFLLAALLLASIALPMGGCRLGEVFGGSENQGNSDGTGTVEEEHPHFSDILQTVLTDSYYLSLTDLSGPMTLSGQQYHQHPFGYLKQEGYNLEDYLSRKFELESDVYIQGDDASKLYIATEIESKHEQGNYYTCYILQYELTEQEYADLEMLHKSNYVQAPFFIQELSYQKQPVSVNKASISKRAYEEMKKDINIYYKDFINKTFVLDFLGYDTNASENYSFTFAVRNAASNSATMIDDKGELRYLISAVRAELGDPVLYGNNVFNGPILGKDDIEEFEKSQPITYFESDYFQTNRSLLNFI